MELQDSRRRTTLSVQLSAAAPTHRTTTSSSPNLRDLLKVRQEEDLHHEQRVCGRRSASISLGTFLACEKRELSAAVTAAVGGRTLLDVMRDEEEHATGAVYGGVVIGSSNGGNMISWRAFRERLRVCRSGPAWHSAAGGGGNALGDVSAAGLIVASHTVVPSSRHPMPEDTLVSAGNVPVQNHSSAISSARVAAAAAARPPMPTAMANSSTEAAGVRQVEGSAATGATQQQPQQQIRLSLMALLEQTDRLGGGGGPGFAVSGLLGPAGDEEEEEVGDDGERGKMYVKCCVCMVRHKGAAFIPCGHTFCRLCSRELWVARGSCPLCNGFILEILDIF